MSARGFYTLLTGAIMLVTALSVGSAVAFLLGAAALCTLFIAFVSAALAALTCRIEQSADAGQVTRQEQVVYTLSARLFSVLPVAPLSLHICLPSGKESEFLLNTSLLGTTISENAFTCPHVGVCRMGVTHVTVSDCFSLFSFRRRVRAPLVAVTVLPNPVDAELPAFSAGEGEHSAAQRAQSDRTTPVDTRAWQEGDELKRVHWKLSMRRQSLMVHTYEMPQRPDALILLDCSVPESTPLHTPHMIDALTEECAGVVRALLESSHPVRMPLCGKRTREMAAQDALALPSMLEALAQESFDAPADFDRVLLLSARRMRRTGSTVVLTSHLTPRIADTVIALSRMGPRTYFTLVTESAMSEQQEKLLHLLLSSGVSARHIPIAV